MAGESNSRISEEIIQLANCMCDGTISTEQRDRLEEILSHHPEFKPLYLDYLRVHAALNWRYRTGDLAPPANQEGFSAASSSAPHGSVGKATTRSSEYRMRPALVGFLGIAALLAAVVGLSFVDLIRPQEQQHGLRMPTIVASVVSAEHVTWKQDNQYVEGDSLREGSELVLAGGVLKINTPSGAELVLQGPCRLDLQSPERIVLKEGRVTANVAGWVSNFMIETESLKVVEAGTQFALEADDQGNAEVHALKGRLRVEPVSPVDESRNSFLLNEGEAVRINRRESRSSMITADYQRFLTKYGEFRPFRPIELHNSGRNLAVGDEDPHWKIIAGAIGAGYRGPQYAVVCEPHVRYLPNTRELSQWLSVGKSVLPGSLPNSVYTFRTEFDLTGYDLSTVKILADILADNGVKELRINGEPVDLLSWEDNILGQEFHRFRRAEIVQGFVPGVNAIEIDVWNGVYRYLHGDKEAEPTTNPMAIRVEWQAFGAPKREAAQPDKTI